MLRKFLIPTVIVSILLLLTTLITIAKTEVASVVTSTTATSVTAAPTTTTTTTTKTAATTQIPRVAKATTKSAIPKQRKITIIHAQPANPKVSRYIYHGHRKNIQGNNNNNNNNTANSRSYSSRIINTNRSYSNIRSNNNKYNKQLLKNVEETTTSLLPLQPTLSVTSTTLASLIINPEQGQQQGSTNQRAKVKQQQRQQPQPQPQKKQDQQQKTQQQRQQQQNRSRQLVEQQKRQNRQPIQDVTNATTTAEPTITTTLTTTTTAATTQQFEKHLINVAQSETDRQPPEKSEKKELLKDFAQVELVTAVPGVTHAYIPFELDYNDPMEEKARPPEVPRQSTLNEVLSNLFPKGFTDIFRYSYAADPEAEQQPTAPLQPKVRSKTRTSSPRTITIPSVPDSTITGKPTQMPITIIKSTPKPFEPMSTEDTQENIKELLDISAAIPFKPMPSSKPKKKLGTGKNSTAFAENSNSDQIVVEKILADLGSSNSSEEFRDGSNSISKDELLRINRAAKQASVLPSMLLNPQERKSSNKTELFRPQKAIVILNDNAADDFIEAPEDDNQIAESQNIAQGVYHAPPPQSVNYQQGQTHEINVHIVHDDTMKKSQDNEVKRRQKEEKQTGEKFRNFQSYQTFVEQAKNLQNSLQEAPSRKFLKNFNPSLSQRSNPSPIGKGNFHYEQTAESHIQTVPPAAQMQYVLFQRPSQLQGQEGEPQMVEMNNQQVKPQPNYRNTHEAYYTNGPYSESNQNKENDNKQVHYIIQLPNYQHNGVEANYDSSHRSSELHTQISDSKQPSQKDAYRIENAEYKEQPQSATPLNLVFVTLSTPEAPQEIHHSSQHQHKNPSKVPFLGPSQSYKLPSQYVHEAINAEPEQQIPDHQPEETENNANPSHSGATTEEGHSDGIEEEGKTYTFVEIQKSINIHNKLITEKDGRLVEQHETIYPPAKYDERLHSRPEYQQGPHHSQQEPHDYVSLSKNPIHVESLEQHEPAESLHAAQHALDPSQSLIDIGAIQQSNLVQESHIIEQPLQESEHAKALQHYPEQQQYDHETHNNHHEVEHHHVDQQPHHHHHHEEHQIHHIEEYHPDYSHAEHHDVLEPSQNPNQPPVQVPYALPLHHHEQAHHNAHHYHHQHYQQPLILQEVIEKHIHIPYAVPEPVAYPVPVQHFIDRPVPVETIVERPVPYAVEKVVEKVVEKHVPVEVEKIVEKPVEKIVEKYVDRPVAIPIKIPVALQITPQSSPYSPYFPSTYGGSGPSNLGPWSQQPTLQRIPTKVLQSYYSKMLKKLVPQMTQAYKTSPLASKPKTVPKFTSNASTKPTFRIGDMRFDLKPPPPPPPHALGSNWDVGARYQYEYNTLPLDLSASSSTAIGKQAERAGPKPKTNFDEFQRWRNGHSLKRSPELGMNLHMEYGFKPPLVPSVEIDDKGVPLKAASDLTKGKDE